ncbi:hypothetical protein HAX54_041621, partial [Datura stramonium]|nr:hypothetical protein [Datura stramonium]
FPDKKIHSQTQDIPSFSRAQQRIREEEGVMKERVQPREEAFSSANSPMVPAKVVASQDEEPIDNSSTKFPALMR